MKHRKVKSCISLISNGTLKAHFLSKTTFKVTCSNPYLTIDTLNVLSFSGYEAIKEKTGYTVEYAGSGLYRLHSPPAPSPSIDNTPF